MNNSANIIRTESFKCAADMIEAVFNVEDWRRDGTILEKIKSLNVNQSDYVKANDLEDIVLTRPEFINSYKGVKIEAKYNGSLLVFIIKPEEETEEREEARPSYLDNIVQNIRTKMFIKKLTKASTPIEAYNLLTEYLAEDQEASGKFRYKDMIIAYSFVYDKETSAIASSMSIGNKVKPVTFGTESTDDVIFQMSANLNPANVDKFYHSAKSFVMNFIK